jgi:hypothetical protein
MAVPPGIRKPTVVCVVVGAVVVALAGEGVVAVVPVEA